MLERRYSKNKIAEILGVHRSTIYRELKRNSFKHWCHDINIYWNDTAHQNYLDRRIISHETIYRYIYNDYGIRNMFYEKLQGKCCT